MRNTSPIFTWAPAGQTPIHCHRQGRRDKISVISGISLSPRRHRLSLYYLLFFDNIGQEEVCGFVRELLRHRAARSSCCWIIPPPTRETPSHTSSGSIPACTSSISPPMRPN